MGARKRLKAKKDLPVLPAMVEEVAGHRHKRLLKGRCPTI
jgi:hypothetical protein